MAKWRVDPDGVLGVLGAVDENGAQLQEAVTAFSQLAASAPAALTAGGRTMLAGGWAEFADARAQVPGKLITVMSDHCARVSTATTEILLGDVEMSENTRERAAQAEAEWGIHDTVDYGLPA